MKKAIVILVLSGFISTPSIAGELEDIMACVDAAAETSGVTLELRDAKWESFFFKDNEIRWSDTFCAVAPGPRVTQLTVNSRRLIIDGIYGEESKVFLDDAKIRIAAAKTELRKRSNELDLLQQSITRSLSEPSADLDAIKIQVNSSIANIFNGDGNQVVDAAIERESAAEEEERRQQRVAETARQEARAEREREATARREASAQQRAEERAREAQERSVAAEENRNSGREFAWTQLGQDSVKEKLRDSRSAEFRNVFFHRGRENVPVTCGEVNSRNAFGALSGFQRFVSAGSVEQTYLEEEVSGFSVVWNELCVAVPN